MFKPKLSTSVSFVVGKGLVDGEYLYDIDEKLCERLKELKKLGFDAVELDVCGMNYAWAAEKTLKYSLEAAREADITVNSVHYPFGNTWVDLASPWEADRKEIVKWFGKVFKITDEYGVRAHVLHPGGIDVTKPELYDVYKDRFHDSVRGLTELTDAYVCIEDMVGGELFNTVDKMEAMLKAVPKACIVLDVNHLLHDTPYDAVKRLGNRIKTLHISDYDFVYERHLMPGEGKIDWNRLIEELENVGYDGRFNYELNMAQHGYTYEQIKENYENLFADYRQYKATK